MQIREAKQIARDWVLSEGRQLPNVIGAYFAGSVNWLPDDAELPPIAALRNPTVRRRYAAAREILAQYDHLNLYEQLLDQLGCARMRRGRVERHLAVLAADAPAELERFTPAYRELLADLGVESLADMRQRAERVKADLPQVWAVAEQIIAAR